jgi:hypothetical protein
MLADKVFTKQTENRDGDERAESFMNISSLWRGSVLGIVASFESLQRVGNTERWGAVGARDDCVFLFLFDFLLVRVNHAVPDPIFIQYISIW